MTKNSTFSLSQKTQGSLLTWAWRENALLRTFRRLLRALLVAACGLFVSAASAQTKTPLLYDSFDTCNGIGGTGSNWSGSTVTGTRQKIVAKVEGWNFHDGYAGKRCAWFGYSSSEIGYAITPSLNISGNGKIEFNAASFTGQAQATTLDISVAEGSATLSTSSFSLTAGSFETYTVNISNASSGLRIKIAASKAEERFFFDEFYAYREEGSEGGGGQEGGGGEATGTADPAISFSASSCVAYVGSPTTYPTFNNPNNLTGISFASSNGSVATVDAETGAVALTGTAGTSTISATFGGNTTYKASTVSYTLNVVNVNSQTYLYKKVTDANDLHEGGSYILVCEAQGKVCKSVSSDKGQPAAAYIADSIACQSETAPLCFILESSSSYWQLKTAEGEYLRTAFSSTDLTLSNATTDYSKWSISFDENGNVSIKNDKNSDRTISYSTGYSIFGNYTESGTSNYNSIQLYQKVYNINIPEVTQGYSTLYNADAAYIMPAGLKGLMVTNAPRTGYITTEVAYTGGKVVPAQTALLLNGTAGKYYAPVTENAGTATSIQNWLHGTRTADNYTSVVEDVYYYKLAVDENNTPGFYWGAEQGAAFLLTKPSTAYLAVPKSVGNASALLFDLNTHIQDVNNGQAAYSPAVYDLCGRRVAQPAKGFYIAGGRKVILK